MGKKMTRKEQAAQTKAHILKVCIELMSKYSFEEISVQSICNAANVSVGSFYHHFTNKAGIIVEIYRDVDERFTNDILPPLLEKDPYDAIIEYLVTQCYHAELMGLSAVSNLYKAQIDNGNTFFLSYDRGLPQGLFQLINRAIEKGALQPDTDANSLMEELLIISRGTIYYWCASTGTIDIKSQVKKLLGMYLKNFRNI